MPTSLLHRHPVMPQAHRRAWAHTLPRPSEARSRPLQAGRRRQPPQIPTRPAAPPPAEPPLGGWPQQLVSTLAGSRTVLGSKEFACGFMAGLLAAKPYHLLRQVQLQAPTKQSFYRALKAVEKPWPAAEGELRGLWHADVVLHDPLLGELHGQDALLERLELLRKMTPLQLEVHSLIEHDALCVARLTARARGPLGLQVELPMSCHMRLAGGRVMEQHNYYDLVGLARSLWHSLRHNRRGPLLPPRSSR